METVTKGDFIEIKFTGTAQGEIFDSNIEQDLKKISKTAPKKVVVVIGQRMVVPGLDAALEGKEIGKEYEITLPAKDGFGDRKRELLKTIPLKVFTERKIDPYPGLMLTLDDMLVKIVTISGARVITDFNNPLAGKELHYRFTIIRKVTDDKERAHALLEMMFRFVPEFEAKDKIVVKGPKELEIFVNAFSDKFKELMGKELAFELKEKTKSSTDHKHHDHSHHSHDHEHDHNHQGHNHAHTH